MMRSQRCRKNLHPTNHGPSPVRFVIEGDIKGCYDAIDHHLLMERVRRRIRDRKVLRLVHAFLKAGILVEGAVRHPVTGTPQGGVLSPLLANVYLTSLDERYGRWTPRPRERLQNAADRRLRPQAGTTDVPDRSLCRRLRYSGRGRQGRGDGRAVSCGVPRQELRMELSLEKTLVTTIEDGFDFLGYRVIRTKALRTGRFVGNLYIPKGKVQKLRDAIEEFEPGRTRPERRWLNSSETSTRSSWAGGLLPLCHRRSMRVQQTGLVAVEAGIALAAKEASQGDVADAAPLSHPRRTGKAQAGLGRGSDATSQLRGGWHQAIPVPRHHDHKWVGRRAQTARPRPCGGAVGSVQPPRQFNDTRDVSRARRAGRRETGSGLSR